MNKEYSVTQASNLAAFLGLIMLILNYFKINITEDEIQALIGALVVAGGLITSFINRYKKGDLKLSGVKKTY